jgi:hypothetical protein
LQADKLAFETGGFELSELQPPLLRERELLRRLRGFAFTVSAQTMLVCEEKRLKQRLEADARMKLTDAERTHRLAELEATERRLGPGRTFLAPGGGVHRSSAAAPRTGRCRAVFEAIWRAGGGRCVKYAPDEACEIVRLCLAAGVPEQAILWLNEGYSPDQVAGNLRHRQAQPPPAPKPVAPPLARSAGTSGDFWSAARQANAERLQQYRQGR